MESDIEAFGTIKIARRRAWWRDRLRSYHVMIDEVERGELRNGEIQRYRVPAGHREVRIAIDWTGSPTVPVEVAAGKTSQLWCGPAGSWLSAPSKIFHRDRYITLELVR